MSSPLPTVTAPLVTLDCGHSRCQLADNLVDGLVGERIRGDDGILYVGVANDNLVQLKAGEVSGLDLDARISGNRF